MSQEYVRCVKDNFMVLEKLVHGAACSVPGICTEKGLGLAPSLQRLLEINFLRGFPHGSDNLRRNGGGIKASGPEPDSDLGQVKQRTPRPPTVVSRIMAK